jgi:diacylglycerol kinase (ATP)
LTNADYRFLFIVNPRAGRKDSVALIKSCIGESPQSDLEVTQRSGHATQLAQDAVKSGYDVVVAVGGDGTLNEVGRALTGTRTAMGIVPAGSGNALARALDIPLNQGDACRQCLTGVERSIDVGRVGDELFLSSAGVGLDAEVCRRFQAEPGARGLFPYVKHTITSVTEYVPEPVRLCVDGNDTVREFRPTLLTIANAPTLGYGAVVAPGADLSDGRLDVCILEGVTLARAVCHGYRLFNGTFDRTPGFSRLFAKSLRIERDVPGPLQVDGEAVGDSENIEVSIVPGGLTVVVPEPR